MTTGIPQSTAKIYQFPVGGRAALSRRNETPTPAADQNVPQIAVGSGWYHDAAIEEARRSSDH